MGQVHRAKLKKSGEEVVIKVQRPKVFEIIKLDIMIFRQLIIFIQHNIGIIQRLNKVEINNWVEIIQKQNLVKIFDQYAMLLLLETNYLNKLS